MIYLSLRWSHIVGQNGNKFKVYSVGRVVLVDRFVVERPPEALDADVIHASVPAVHRDSHIRVQRAQIILLSADRLPVGAALCWEGLCAEEGVDGLLRDNTRPPCKPLIKAYWERTRLCRLTKICQKWNFDLLEPPFEMCM